jgi:threonine aldolase
MSTGRRLTPTAPEATGGHLGAVIDCRSDVLTQPTEAMWEAMQSAQMGWGMQNEDSSINELQAYAADLTGMEAALYVPSGTMANLLALMTHTNRGDHVVLDAYSHILWSEEWSFAYICGLVSRTVHGDLGVMAPRDVESAIGERRFNHRPPFRLLCLENTHNMAGGTMMTPAHTEALSSLAHENGIAVHIDGARILNACVALNVSVQTFARHVDTLSLNLNKGLSAPGGALLCGPARFVREGRQNLKRLGGWSAIGKAGLSAAAGLVALQTMIPQLAEDNRRARDLAERLAVLENVEVDLRTVQTNIVMVRVPESLMSAERFLRRLEQSGVRAYDYLPDTVRFVLHRHVDDGDVSRIVEVVRDITANA